MGFGCFSSGTRVTAAPRGYRLVLSLAEVCGAGSRGLGSCSTVTRAPGPAASLPHHSRARLAQGQDICGRSRDHIHISESRKEEEEERVPLPSLLLLSAAFLEASPRLLAHLSPHISARAPRASPSCGEAGEGPLFGWAQIALNFRQREERGLGIGWQSEGGV